MKCLMVAKDTVYSLEMEMKKILSLVTTKLKSKFFWIDTALDIVMVMALTMTITNKMPVWAFIICLVVWFIAYRYMCKRKDEIDA